MQGGGYQWEKDFGKKCQRWVVTRDAAWRCEHAGCNIAVFKRTLLSILHSQASKNHFFGRKNRMVQPDSLNAGCNGYKPIFTAGYVSKQRLLCVQKGNVPDIGTLPAFAQCTVG